MVSMDLPDGVGLDVVDQLRIRPHGGHAALFMMISRSPSLNEVERAEVAGADGFIDIQNVEDALERIRVVIDRRFGPSPRILCVGIEPYAEAFTSVIESAGYLVRMVENGSHIDVDLARFDPDAIVAGIAGEGQEALRLARTVNLLSGSACPVILIGSGLSATLRVDANRAGAADVLQIPLSRALLLTTLEKHVTAARASKMALRHDPLTGCLRETFFRERLQKRLNERMLNRRSTLVLVETEETFACAVADLLRRRLRETDEIGRLGGGLFGVLMERIDEAHAAALCAKLRDESGTPFRTAVAVQSEDRTGAEWLARAQGIMRSLTQPADGDASPSPRITQAYAGSDGGITVR
jgi:PleD family two-component response regulator